MVCYPPYKINISRPLLKYISLLSTNVCSALDEFTRNATTINLFYLFTQLTKINSFALQLYSLRFYPVDLITLVFEALLPPNITIVQQLQQQRTQLPMTIMMTTLRRWTHGAIFAAIGTLKMQDPELTQKFSKVENDGTIETEQAHWLKSQKFSYFPSFSDSELPQLIAATIQLSSRRSVAAVAPFVHPV